VPFAQPETSEQGLEDLFRRKPYKPSSPAPHANTSASPAVAQAPAAHEQAAEEDRKMPATPVTTLHRNTSETTQGKQVPIEAYLAKWTAETPSERHALQAQGQDMLEQVEALKKDEKRVHRQNVMGVEMPDADPWVWSQSLQGQRKTEAQLEELRSMRSQLIENLQPTAAELSKSGMHVARDASHEAVLYSSDEEESPFPPSRTRHRKVVAKPVFQQHDVQQMHASQKGLDFIGVHEGFRAQKYKVGGHGNDTIGYGHEFLPGENFSQGVTKERALQLLEQDAQDALQKVREYVTVPLKQHQLDALVSYVYNTGSLEGTQLVEKLNAGDFEGAASEMDIVTQQATGKVLPGLEKRRKVEQKLFLYGYDD
jgi:lysozyme